MARIQYQPAARSRGFKPRQISTAGISRMREESNRMITNMELNRQAEKEQRDRNLQAIKENNAYTERIQQQNFATEIQNLQAEKNAELGAIQLEAAEAQAKQAQTQNTLNLISSISKTAAQGLQTLDAELLKQDIAAANAAFLQTPDEYFTPEQQQHAEDAKLGQSKRAQGSVKYNADVTALDAQIGAPQYQTFRSIASNPGLKGRSLQIYKNLVAYKAYTTTYQQNLLDGGNQYTASDGRQFTGLEAADDPYLAGELQRLTLVDVMAKMGITEPTYLAQAHEKIISFNQAATSQANTNALEQAVAIGMEEAAQLISGDAYDDAVQAYDTVKQLQGHVAALDFVTDGIANPNTSAEMREHLGNLVINGKKFSEGWKKNRWLPALEKAETDRVKMETADRKLQQDALNNEVFNNIDAVTEFIDEDPYANGFAVEKRFTDQGFTVPAYITKHISNARKQNDEIIEADIIDKLKNNIIDDKYIEGLPTEAWKEFARNKKVEQEDKKWGPNYDTYTKGLLGNARKLTQINTGANTLETYLLHGKSVEIFNEFIEKSGFDTKSAAEATIKLMDAAHNGTADSSNPFHYVYDKFNKRKFTHIQTDTLDITQRSNLVDKKILIHGAGIYNEPFLTATAAEMDATYKSSLEGNTIYPPLILSTAAKLGLKPSEAYNEVRKVQNLFTGENKPLLNANDSVVRTIDAADVRARELITSDNVMQIRRGGVSVGVGGLPVRVNMPGGGFSALSGLIKSGEGSYTSMFPSENYPEMVNMSIGEVVSLQKQKLQDGRASAAVGAYQFLYPEEAAKLAGLSMNDQFSPENQDKMLLATLLNKPGRENLSAFLRGQSDNVELAIDELSQEFASFASRDGLSYHATDGVNKASISRSQAREALMAARKQLTNKSR